MENRSVDKTLFKVYKRVRLKRCPTFHLETGENTNTII